MVASQGTVLATNHSRLLLSPDPHLDMSSVVGVCLFQLALQDVDVGTDGEPDVRRVWRRG
jgi:hypothetical protein